MDKSSKKSDSKDPASTAMGQDSSPRPWRLEAFSKFSELPTELRLQVWEISLLKPRMIAACSKPLPDKQHRYLTFECSGYCFDSQVAISSWDKTLPLAFYINKESRAIALAMFPAARIPCRDLPESDPVRHYGPQFAAFSIERDTILFCIAQKGRSSVKLAARHTAVHISPMISFGGCATAWTPYRRSLSRSYLWHIDRTFKWFRAVSGARGLLAEEMKSVTLIMLQSQRYHDPSLKNGPFPFCYDDFPDREKGLWNRDDIIPEDFRVGPNDNGDYCGYYQEFAEDEAEKNFEFITEDEKNLNWQDFHQRNGDWEGREEKISCTKNIFVVYREWNQDT